LSLEGSFCKNPYEILNADEIEADWYGQNTEFSVRMTKILFGIESCPQNYN